MNGRRWTPEEIKSIRSAEKASLSIREALLLLPGRSLGSLQKKLSSMGITLPLHQEIRQSLSLEKGQSPIPASDPDSSRPRCCWPLNDRWPWKFCDAPFDPDRTHRNSSYCPEHRSIAVSRTPWKV